VGGLRKVSTSRTSLPKNLKRSSNDDANLLVYEVHVIWLLFGPFYECVSGAE
jgi:hypothetical protein